MPHSRFLRDRRRVRATGSCAQICKKQCLNQLRLRCSEHLHESPPGMRAFYYVSSIGLRARLRARLRLRGAESSAAVPLLSLLLVLAERMFSEEARRAAAAAAAVTARAARATGAPVAARQAVPATAVVAGRAPLPFSASALGAVANAGGVAAGVALEGVAVDCCCIRSIDVLSHIEAARLAT